MPEQNDNTTTKKYYDPISIAKRTKQVVHMVEDHHKMAMLAYIIDHSDLQQTAVICKSKKRADALGAYLNEHGQKTKVIHGNHRKSDQEEVAQAFTNEEINLLITTDMILQKLELKNIERIVNFDTPIEATNYFNSLEYVDEKGESISLVAPEEEKLFSTIEFLLKIEIPCEEVEGFVPTDVVPVTKASKEKKKKPRSK
ncbi:MAG: DEAD/DEAH box helicase [Sulfurimonas sp.]